MTKTITITLEEIKKQHAKVEAEKDLLATMQKVYVDENRKYKNGDVLLCRRYDFLASEEKVIVISAHFSLDDMSIKYFVAPLTKSGEEHKGRSRYSVVEKNMRPTT